jgi:hypothetical protein
MKLVYILFFLFTYTGTHAQQLKGILSDQKESAAFSGSDISLVVIETNGGFSIPDEVKIKAHMKIIDAGPGEWNTPLDAGNVYDGNIGIEIRGSYSASLPQKPYGFETRDSLGNNLNVPLLGMPEENDWILLANYNDKSFVRNSLAGHIFRYMGHYAPRTNHCEVLVNGTYQGIYVLTEKIKRDKNRVDIATLYATENSGDEVTGGYIFKTDYYSSYDSWISNFHPANWPGKNVHFVYSYPGADEITEAQKAYIQSYVNSFEEVLYGGGFKDSRTGYAAYIDVESFRDYFILSEVSRNVDAYKKSRFFYKDKESKGGKINSGPPWDYDWAWKDIWDCYMFSNTDGSGWAYEVNNCDVWPTPPVYMTRLLEDEHFANGIKRRYVELRKSVLSDAAIFAYIDSVNHYLAGAQQRHYATWDILGENVGAPEVGTIPTSFLGETVKFKTWIQTRLAWLDLHMPGDEFGSVSAENQAVTILRLFPNPASDIVYIESDVMIDRVEIFTISGTRVYVRPGGPEFSTAVDIRQFPAGIYLVHIITANGENLVEKLVIR